MKNRKGYSLIELLAVIIIMGLILLIVIPAVSRLLTNNSNKEYNYYLKAIKAGATTYASKNEDELGTNLDSGCLEVSIDELIKNEYLKKFKDEKVTCDGKVRLNNDKGNLKVAVNLTCKDFNNEETYKVTEIEGSTCLAYKPKDDDGLKDIIVANWCNKSSGNCTTNDNVTYVIGNNPRNYVWYSGKLWRVVNYNESTGVIKLLCNDIITIIPRTLNDSIEYENSYVDKYLQEIFLPTLKDSDKFLKETEWNVGSTSFASAAPDSRSTIIRSVGLLNAYETHGTNRMTSYFTDAYYWLLSNHTTNGKIYLAMKNSDLSNYNVSAATFNKEDYFAIRPAITMKINNYVIGGEGTLYNPYILEGNSTNVKEGTKINTRYSGEYVKVNNLKYRIIRVEDGLTKITLATDFILNKKYTEESDTMYYRYSMSDLKNYLNNEWFNTLSYDKKLIEENASWCEKVISSREAFSNTCPENPITAAVGLPTLGDLYTVNNSMGPYEFWTINARNTNGIFTINTILAGSSVTNGVYGDPHGELKLSELTEVKPVMYLKSNVTISGGEGTNKNPFTLILK